jgi:hypothetical protein
VELSVASVVFLLLLGATVVVFQHVLTYHRRTDTQISLEREVLLTLKALSRECSESSWASIEASPAGLVFGTPRDAFGEFQIGPDDEPAWAGIVCYTRDPLAPDLPLLKRVDYFASPLPTVPEPLSLVPPRDPAWFGASDLPARAVARGVERFEVERETVGDEDGREAIRIDLTIGDGNNLSLELSTRVRPRN